MIMADAERRPTLAEYRAQGQSGDAWTCPRCGCRDWRTPYGWRLLNGDKRRKKVCRNCGKEAMITTETPDK